MEKEIELMWEKIKRILEKEYVKHIFDWEIELKMGNGTSEFAGKNQRTWRFDRMVKE